jgi:hypothetical protein
MPKTGSCDTLEELMILNQEVKKWATDLHIFLHKAEMFLPMSNNAEEFVGKVFSNFEEKPQFLSNDEAEEMLHELWSAYKDGRLD